MSEKKSSDEALLALEKSLKTKLSQVKPDQNFIGNLHRRLEDSPVYRQQRRKAATLLSIAAGLLVGLAIFLVGRAFIQEANEAC